MRKRLRAFFQRKPLPSYDVWLMHMKDEIGCTTSNDETGIW